MKSLTFIVLLFSSITLYANEAEDRELTHHQGMYNPVLGNRFFVVDFLEKVFGKGFASSSSSYRGQGKYYYYRDDWRQGIDSGLTTGERHSVSNTLKYILSKQSIWGGPCDIYDMSETRPNQIEFPKTFCHTGGGKINAKFNINSSVVREGYKILVCEYILEQGNVLVELKEEIGLSNGDPTYAHVEKLYKIFFPNRATDDQLTREAIEALVDVGIGRNLKAVVMTLCYDPSWQML